MQNKRKEKRQSGKAYTTKKGKLIQDRSPKPVACKCHHKCMESFDEDSRMAVNQEFWNLGDYEKQHIYLRTCVTIEKCKRGLKQGSRRENTFGYKLREIKVCKKFFMATLNITEGYICTFAKKVQSGEFRDKRGVHGNHHKLNPEIAAKIKSHIESFPAVESHYTRAKSNRLYLPAHLSISKMHFEFEKAFPDLKVTESCYRRIFCNEYNYSFHKPKKDTCITCAQYLNAIDKAPLQDSYDEHIRIKERAREEIKSDKSLAEKNSNLKVYTFDLEAVLKTPCSNVSALYYSRKFASYNNTFYDLATADGYCYLWDETDGERGADEIGSAILQQVNSLDASLINDIIFYCDCCGGQNRNKFIGSLLVHLNKTMTFD